MTDTSSIHITSSNLSKLDLNATGDENNNSAKAPIIERTASVTSSTDTARTKKNSVSSTTANNAAAATAATAAPATTTAADNTMTASELPNGQIPSNNSESQASAETNINNNQSPSETSDNNNAMQNVASSQEVTPNEPELHELQTEWSLWLYTNNKARKWEENLQHVISFKTVEEFWAVYNHIQLSSKLTPGHDYALFRAGTRPAWEDEANKTGGRWMLQLPAKQHRATNLDRLWLELMLLIIGEDFNNPEEASLINGAVVSIRFKEDRIALWTGDSSQGQNQRAIGQQLKTRLNLQCTLHFERHADQSGPKNKHKPSLYSV